MISDSEIALSTSSRDEIKFTGDFFQNPKNADVIKTAINSSKDIKSILIFFIYIFFKKQKLLGHLLKHLYIHYYHYSYTL